MMDLKEFLNTSLTAYHACDNVKNILDENGFTPLHEWEDWNIAEGGKYYIVRGGSIIAFTIDSLDDFAYKIAATHNDSPALKLKENPVMNKGGYTTLNVEAYGGGIWYSFFDRPLKIAGRAVKKDGSLLVCETVTSPFFVSIPSVAIHQNRTVNESFAVNKQIDLPPLVGLDGALTSADLIEKIAGENVLSSDLFLVNGADSYYFGVNGEFFASPRIDNLTSTYAAIEGLLSHAEKSGICVAACLDHEEVGNTSTSGANSDFLENVLRRVAYAFRFDDNEYYKALASSFLLSADNAHAVHPNHPEKSDPTNRTLMGQGVVIKSHAGQAYVTDAMSAAVVKTVFDGANVPYQHFFNHSESRSGSTLGHSAISHVSIAGADVGIAQLAMHSSCECIATSDLTALTNGMRAFFGCTLRAVEKGFVVENGNTNEIEE